MAHERWGGVALALGLVMDELGEASEHDSALTSAITMLPRWIEIWWVYAVALGTGRYACNATRDGVSRRIYTPPSDRVCESHRMLFCGVGLTPLGERGADADAGEMRLCHHLPEGEGDDTVNTEMIAAGRMSAQHAFQLRGTGALGSGLYCTTTPLRSDNRVMEIFVDRAAMFDGVETVDDAQRLRELNQDHLTALWEGRAPAARATLIARYCELFGGPGAVGAEVEEAVRELERLYRHALNSETLALLQQPLSYVMRELGYAGFIYSGDLAHMNDSLAAGAIVFTRVDSILLPKGTTPMTGIRIPLHHE